MLYSPGNMAISSDNRSRFSRWKHVQTQAYANQVHHWLASPDGRIIAGKMFIATLTVLMSTAPACTSHNDERGTMQGRTLCAVSKSSIPAYPARAGHNASPQARSSSHYLMNSKVLLSPIACRAAPAAPH